MTAQRRTGLEIVITKEGKSGYCETAASEIGIMERKRGIIIVGLIALQVAVLMVF